MLRGGGRRRVSIGVYCARHHGAAVASLQKESSYHRPSHKIKGIRSGRSLMHQRNRRTTQVSFQASVSQSGRQLTTTPYSTGRMRCNGRGTCLCRRGQQLQIGYRPGRFPPRRMRRRIRPLSGKRMSQETQHGARRARNFPRFHQSEIASSGS